MKTKYLVLSGALLLAASSLSFAEDAPGGPPPGQPGGNQDGPRRPPNPLLHIFDTNHDGVISADEIAAAPAALKALDKNSDGQLTAEELRPPGGKKDGKGKKAKGDQPASQ
ncbi:MAG: EF-hand domain-containing protein [Opitutaceae bacterium]|jgi:hypothetical protein